MIGKVTVTSSGYDPEKGRLEQRVDPEAHLECDLSGCSAPWVGQGAPILGPGSPVPNLCAKHLAEDSPKSDAPVFGDAHFSTDGLYRLELSRTWDRTLPTLAGIGLNPSTAGAEKNDPTVLRLIAFARAWGYGSLMLGNLYAFRSPHPKALTHVADPVGPQNDMILQGITRGRCVLVMWGATIVPKLWVRERARRVLELVGHGASQVTCLGFTSDGSPIHPMARGKHRVPDGVSPKVFPWRTWK